MATFDYPSLPLPVSRLCAPSYVLCSPFIQALSGLLFYPRCFPLCWPNVFFFFTCVLLTRPCTKVCVSPVVSVSPSCVNRCAPPCLAACFLLLWCLFVLSGFLFNLIWTLWRMCVHIASPAVHVSLQTDWVARHKYNRVQHWKTAKMEEKHVIIGLNFSTSAVILSAGCWGTWDFIENDR